MQTTDRTGAVAYEATFRYFSALRVAAVTFFVLLVASLSVNLLQFRRPPQVSFIRVDDAGRMAPLRLRDSDYTPREAEVVSLLHAWALARYRLMRPTVVNDFGTNYYFMDAHLQQQVSASDAALVAKVKDGTAPEQDVEVKAITFRAFSGAHSPGGVIGSGECVIDLQATSSATGSQVRMHWLVTITYKLNPTASAERARTNPDFQVANPLGLTITYFHEDRAFD